MKTHKGAKKRFKKTSTGKIRRGRRHKQHLAAAKSPKRTRQLRRPAVVSDADAPTVRKQLSS
ncbi:MAG: 50S ribosomal protein L35 [Acidimicrobiales bacterium]